jgi:hypothetical protein
MVFVVRFIQPNMTAHVRRSGFRVKPKNGSVSDAALS